MLRGLILSAILHIFLVILIIYIMPHLLYKNNQNLEIAVDIISVQELPLLPNLNRRLLDNTPKQKTTILPKPILDDNKIIEKKPEKKEVAAKEKVEKKKK